MRKQQEYKDRKKGGMKQWKNGKMEKRNGEEVDGQNRRISRYMM